MTIGIIREGKVPPDSRVPLNPTQCKAILEEYPSVKIIVQPSPNRCFKDAEYEAAGIPIQEDLSACEVLMGVKEVPIDQLVSDKIYFFFSHTIKEQVYNRKLLQRILTKQIQLLDYEVLTNDKKQRLIAFGVFAGMVGAHNALWTYGKRTGKFELKRMKDFFDYAEAKAAYAKLELPPVKIVLTGGGRVANGAAKVLEDMGIERKSAEEFLTIDLQKPVFTQLDCHQYAARKDDSPFDLQHFFKNPSEYKSIFDPYTKIGDIMINGIYWDNEAPAFFTSEDMQQDDFKINVIADVTCDIAPVSSIPSTLKASTIADPVFGYDPKTG
ncbi:MAG: NAD(P)-dependent oxidoreductase, partial [Saprospiraceae bacterium]